MSNIAQEKLQKIADETSVLIDEINEGVEWSDDYLKDENKEETSYALKTYRRKLKKVKAAIIQKPVIALFGASQVGKSYLVKNIFVDENNKFKIPDDKNNETYDFIADINPIGGGSEATSVVTRFTHDVNKKNYPLPVKIRLLSAKAVVTILIDSYLSDIKKRKEEVKRDEIKLHIDNFDKLFSNQALQYFIDEDDIYDIDDYVTELFFESNLRSKLQAFKDEGFWHKLAAVINKIPYTNWGEVFDILWGKQEKLTKLFNILINELNNINFSKVIYSGFDSVLRKPNGTILDVERLRLILVNQGDSINVQSDAKKQFQIKRNTLCALAHEVILNISESSVEKHTFVDNVDMLDFPGARSRMELDESDNFSDEQISDMYLRGKVSFLFNSYSMNYEISNLFVCTPTEKTEVRGLPELVDKWIDYNIGKTASERASLLQNVIKPPLFVIFTFWNVQLKYDRDNDTESGIITTNVLNHKWAHRFDKRIHEDLFGRFTWYKDWTTNEPNFKNYYLLRDFKYSDEIFEGYIKEGKETKRKSEYNEYYEKLEESFKKSEIVKEFFSDPETVWNETSTVGKDGSQYIINSMAKVSNNKSKTKRYLNILNNAKNEVESKLKEHHTSNDATEQIYKAKRDADDLYGRMNKVFGKDAFNFGSFIEHLTISENEILSFYYELLKDNIIIEKESTNEYVLYKERSPELSTEKTYKENLEVLRKDYSRGTIDEVEEYFKKTLDIDLNELFFGELHNLKNKSLILAESARNYWFEKKLNVDNFEFFVDLGFEKQLLEKLFEKIKSNFKNLKLTRIIAKNIRVYVDRYNNVDKAQDMIAHMTAGIINEFVNSMGWTYISKSKKDSLIDTNKKLDLGINFPQEDDVFKAPQEEDVTHLFEIMNKLNDRLNERPIAKETVENVPMLKNYRRWRELMKVSFIANYKMPNHDIKGNEILGELINQIKVHNFSI